jgi:hypothetical protein
METVPYPVGSLLFIDNSLLELNKIKIRDVAVEDVHKILEDMYKELKKLINFREKYLKEENLSVINLSTVMHTMLVNDNNSIYIKVNDIIMQIFFDDDIRILDNYNAYAYSINKVNNTQKLYYAHHVDAKLHQLVKEYKEVKSMYTYKVGNRVELKTFMGSYVIVSIYKKTAVITCKKWKAEGKPDKLIKVSDIKGLASNTYNSLSTW